MARHGEARADVGAPEAPAPTRIPALQPPEQAGSQSSALRYPLLLLLTILIGGIAGYVASSQRDPKYTSTVRMAVAGLRLTGPGAGAGFSTASQTLATSYSRSIDADGVILPAARQLGLGRGVVTNAVTATPIPESAIFVLTSKADSRRSSIAIANAVADSLVAFIDERNARGDSTRELLARYRAQSRTFNRAELAVSFARDDYEDDPTARNRRELADARAEAQTASVRLGALRTAYEARRTSGAEPGVEVLRRATTAGSDRARTRQIYIFVGLVGGAVLGFALATLRSSRLARRTANA